MRYTGSSDCSTNHSIRIQQQHRLAPQVPEGSTKQHLVIRMAQYISPTVKEEPEDNDLNIRLTGLTLNSGISGRGMWQQQGQIIGIHQSGPQGYCQMAQSVSPYIKEEPQDIDCNPYDPCTGPTCNSAADSGVWQNQGQLLGIQQGDPQAHYRMMQFMSPMIKEEPGDINMDLRSHASSELIQWKGPDLAHSQQDHPYSTVDYTPDHFVPHSVDSTYSLPVENRWSASTAASDFKDGHCETDSPWEMDPDWETDTEDQLEVAKPKRRIPDKSVQGISLLDLVESTQPPEKNARFHELLMEFKTKQIDIYEVVEEVEDLFQGEKWILYYFSAFYPKWYREYREKYDPWPLASETAMYPLPESQEIDLEAEFNRLALRGREE
ncbi:hypothetical protein BJ508DRAFT_308234 [Ascobolus immersus RN42]|uniref:Uncharacterized protein n=1 Tax=Ascobolus immersus RN42 TaxID=1160509 RepID=A0A3N4I0W7_ASCIM|nr:hypothetical protein BJ508DRAFT_308234 [Ascobolus immersus RN42]